MNDVGFRQFVMEHRKLINDFIDKYFPLQDEAFDSKLRRGFERCVKPVYETMARQEETPGQLSTTQKENLILLVKLLVLAIKKRYYAFPDKGIVAVSQDLLFDRIASRAAAIGLLGTSFEVFWLLFNAGENLRELSTPFYAIMDDIIDVVQKTRANIQDTIHVSAWFAGDVKRREHAISVLRSGSFPAAVLVKLMFHEVPVDVLDCPPELIQEIRDLLLQFLINDHWFCPASLSSIEEYAKLANLLKEKKRNIPAQLKKALILRDENKHVAGSTSMGFLGKAGSYEGFGGYFDSPPVIAGYSPTGRLMVQTRSGKIFHVDYGGVGARIQFMGDFPCRRLLYTTGGHLVAFTSNNEIVSLSDSRVLGILPGPEPVLQRDLLVTAAENSVFFWKK
nr:hypothetical protein [Candidatus Sigynarchaeota archaeon]